MAEDEDKFDWSPENPNVIIRPQEAVAVYANPDNDIVIRRERMWDEEDDTFVVIPRNGARRFIEAIERLLLPEGTR